MHLSDLKHKSISDLASDAAEHAIESAHGMKRQELIFALLQSQSARGGEIEAEGVIEVLPDGFGFLRAPDHNYLPGADDIYVSPSQIRRFNLRTGDTVVGLIRPPKDSERYFALLRVNEINGGEPDGQRNKILFDNLTPVYPDEAFSLVHGDALSLRIVQLLCPLGKGQRCLVTSPPRAGKTVLLRQLAQAIEANHPDAVVMVLLIDERPEEVTEMRRAVAGEVISSTFDEPPSRHVQVAEIVIEKAKRLAESGQDVVILLDSITQLGRAYNTVVPASGKMIAGVVDAHALHKPKRFWGAARKLDAGGSLSIVATALIETGSRVDEVILEEFAGTSNAEIHLDRTLMERRIFPCIDLHKSGTRKEELLMTKADLARAWALRERLHSLDPIKAMELLQAELGD